MSYQNILFYFIWDNYLKIFFWIKYLKINYFDQLFELIDQLPSNLN